jgi:hypothetical protein
MDPLYQATVVTPAGTSPDVPLQTAFPLVDGTLTAVTILIPDGHSGLTGIRILQADQEIIPWSNDDWLISNDEVISISVNTSISAVGLTIETYNTDAFEHRHWVRAQVINIGVGSSSSSATVAALPVDVLSNL